MPRDLHPEGRFYGTVVDHGFKESTNGFNQIFLTIENEQNPDHKITSFMSMNGEVSPEAKAKNPDAKPAIFYTVASLRNAGYCGFDFEELADGTLLRGNRVNYVVEHEMYENELRDRVKWINDPNKAGIQRSEKAKVSAKLLNSFLAANPPDPAKQPPDGVPF